MYIVKRSENCYVKLNEELLLLFKVLITSIPYNENIDELLIIRFYIIYFSGEKILIL